MSRPYDTPRVGLSAVLALAVLTPLRPAAAQTVAVGFLPGARTGNTVNGDFTSL